MAQDDLDPALALVTEDFVIDESLILPDGGKYFGREGFVAFAAEVRDRWRELDFGIDEVHDLGEAIVVEAHVDLRGRLTDATARQRFVHVFVLEDEKVKLLDTFPTLADAGAALEDRGLR